MKSRILYIIILLVFAASTSAENKPFKLISSDSLLVNDGLSEQLYLWKNGKLTMLSAKLNNSKTLFSFKSSYSDISNNEEPVNTSINIIDFPETERTSAYSQIDLSADFEHFSYVRSLRVYKECPGIEWRLKIKGNNKILFPKTNSFSDDLIENPKLLSDNIPHYFFLPFSSPHQTTKIVSFKESTDHHSNIVEEKTELPYVKSQFYRGNTFIVQDNKYSQTHLIVKLSPLQFAQSEYKGFDFSSSFSGVKVHSPGFETASESNNNKWQEAYPLFVLLFADNEQSALHKYKLYELAKHRYLPQKDNTFTMNTWGDRNRDSRVNEQFILNELDAAHRLGVTHYQIDDGWQQGLSRNSAQKGNVLWEDWEKEDWEVNKTRFPNGLQPITEKADSLNINLGLWFNPSDKNNYSMWERDQSILLNLHKTHNITWIKIDGLSLGNKESEINVYNMLQGSIDSTNGEMQFNMDVTAGKRGGYFFLNHLGNIFLENRYTDWGNYYPHLTLRNVWQLSKYVPIQRFQIEFLNKWRNKDKYPADDPLKPFDIPFDYQFATTMIGQPLAWMEATALPDEAYNITSIIEKWKQHRSHMQQGVISPIGNTPDGYSFTGFISNSESRTYLLLFRENTDKNKSIFTLPFAINNKQSFVKLAGEGAIETIEDNKVEVSFTAPFRYLWGYFE